MMITGELGHITIDENGPRCVCGNYGGVARAGELLLVPLRRSAETCSLPAAWKGTRILSGESGTTAIALGAASTVLAAAFSPAMTPVTFYRSRALPPSASS